MNAGSAVRFFLLAALIFGLCGVAGAATTPSDSLNTAPGTLIRPPSSDLESMQSAANGRYGHPHGASDMRRAMAIERRKDLHKKVASQSAQLLILVKKLNAEVAKSNANQLSVSVVKEAEEIEKLAKSIQTKTKERLLTIDGAFPADALASYAPSGLKYFGKEVPRSARLGANCYGGSAPPSVSGPIQTAGRPQIARAPWR